MTAGEIAGTIAVALGVIASGIAAWRKTASRDSVDIAEDRSKEGYLERQTKRADDAEARADALFAEVMELAKANARLSSENDYLKRFYGKAMHDMPEDKRKQWETDFSPLGGPEIK